MQDVKSNDMWILLLSTIRYSMGRMTYMSSLSGDLVIKYADYLEDFQLTQIKQEVETELRIHWDQQKRAYEKTGEYLDRGHLGHICDVDNWTKFVERLQKVLNTREA